MAKTSIYSIKINKTHYKSKNLSPHQVLSYSKKRCFFFIFALFLYYAHRKTISFNCVARCPPKFLGTAIIVPGRAPLPTSVHY